jgi:hypothetical protein
MHGDAICALKALELSQGSEGTISVAMHRRSAPATAVVAIAIFI